MENDNFDDYMDRLKIKLDKNPELSDKIEEYKDKLSKIFETDIDITLNFSENIESYRNVLNDYDEDGLLDSNDEQSMVLSEFIEMLQTEKGNLKLSFDPLHMKKGINNINNMLITTYDDTIIIVPIRKKEEE